LTGGAESASILRLANHSAVEVMVKRFAAAAALYGLLAAPAGAAVVSTDALREWNLIVLGDLTSSSEVEGRTFVGGNLSGSSSNYQASGATPASPTGQPGLTVVGNVTGGHKNLNNGSGAVVGGNVTSGFNLNGPPQTVKVGGTIANTNVNQNTVRSGLAQSDAYFLSNLNQQKALLVSSLTDLSDSLSQLAANSTLTIAHNRATLVAAPDTAGMAVFNLTAADLNRFGEIALNVNGADTVVINVSGAGATLNDNFLGGTANLGQRVIWNFHEATSLTLTTAWGGSILAPRAAATTANYVQGSAVFASLTQNGEFHLGTYAGSYFPPLVPPGGDNSPGGGSGGGGGGTPVPEPAAWPALLAALALLWAARRRSRP
jgi:choice-of-anchor A domain-containing protein